MNKPTPVIKRSARSFLGICLLLALCAALLLSCAPLPQPTTPAETTPEETTPTVTTPEVTTPEVTTPEVTTPEVTIPEVTTPEVTTPEATTPEVTTPKATTPEATTPEVTTPEVTTPEATTPEVTTPEITTPETTTPPEQTTPEPPPTPPVQTHRFTVSFGEADHANGEYPVGTVITLSVPDYKLGYFLSWTDDRTAAEGGTVISAEPTYTFTLMRDTDVCANYTPFAFYHLEGGVVSESGESTFADPFVSNFSYMYNTVGDVGTFVRAGYTLLEYNTEPDGSGIAVNPGGKIEIPEAGELHLYAVWSKWSRASDFGYEVLSDGSGVAIHTYSGNDTVLSIPASLGGKPVKRILANAFKNKNFVTLIIPSSVVAIEKNAFQNCPDFDELYLCDNIAEIYNESFVNCRAFTRFRYNAAMGPTYISETAFCRKFELVMMEKGNTIVVMGGSSGLYGLNSPLLEELLNYQYAVINYGTNMGSNGILYSEFCSYFLEEGDIFIAAPEYGGVQYGSVSMEWKTLRATELCYNIYRYVDMSHYTNLFGAIYKLNTEQKRLARKQLTYSQNMSGLNEHGDTTGNAKHSNFSVSGSTNPQASLLTKERIAAFNMVFDILGAKGVRVYFTHPTVTEGYLASGATDASLAAYCEAIRKNLHCTLISDDPRDYVIPYEYMCNSVWHANSTGAIIRTETLAAELLAQFEKEK